MTSPLWSAIQRILTLKPDGIPGPVTLAAVADSLDLASPSKASWTDIRMELDLPPESDPPGEKMASRFLLHLQVQGKTGKDMWPREWEAEAFFGKPGKGLQLMELPYPLLLSWDTKETVTRMTCHSLVAIPLKRIFSRTLAHYGREDISQLGLNLFGGCYNNRPKTGGTALSMHAYGIAVDLDPDHNRLKWDSTRAAFARHYYDAFWSFVEDEGAVSLGRTRNYDWMHFQFARLNG